MTDSSVDGLVSGLNTSQIISQLMQVEQQPQQLLKQERTGDQTRLDAWQAVATSFGGVGAAAQALATSGAWQTVKATSSDATTVSATAGSGAGSGSLTFTVGTLASAHALVSSGSVADLSAVVASGNLLLSQAAGLGLATVAGDAALALGAHTVTVTQASAAAVKLGDAALDAGTTLGAGATVTLNLDGAATTLNLAAGSYATPAALVDAVNAAIRGAGAGLVAGLDAGGRLRLATSAEGSAHSLQVTGGTALGALKLSSDASALVGTDGVLGVDGTTTTLSDVRAGVAATVNLAGGGSVTATLAGGLRVGSAGATNVSLGDGSLAAVTAAINAAGAGMTATAVQVGAGAYRLQLAATATGAASALTLDPTRFSAALGTLGTLVAGADAKLTVGSGANAYTVTSASNSVTGLLPGVTLNLLKTSPDIPVTVTMRRDGDALADKVGQLVDAVNSTVSTIKSKSGYDPTTRTAGPLLGDATVEQLQQQIYGAVSGAVSSSSLGSPGLAGVTLNADGTVAFDRAKFLSAFAANPDAVAALFKQGGTAGSGLVGFNGATVTTRAGAYGVTVTQAATRSSVTGNALATVAADETVAVRVGGTSVSYTARAGATLDTVAAGLNAAFAAQALGVTATVESSRLVLRSNLYGSAGQFEVRSSGTGLGLVTAADAWQAHTDGLDVAGWFLAADGVTHVAASGTGQVLSASALDPALGGLSVKVTAAAADLPLATTVGYTPGLAQRLDTLVRDATNSVDGRLTVAVNGGRSTMRDLDTQIADWDTRLAQREQLLRNQFAQLEVSLGQLRDQGNWLSGQIAKL